MKRSALSNTKQINHLGMCMSRITSQSVYWPTGAFCLVNSSLRLKQYKQMLTPCEVVNWFPCAVAQPIQRHATIMYFVCFRTENYVLAVDTWYRTNIFWTPTAEHGTLRVCGVVCVVTVSIVKRSATCETTLCIVKTITPGKLCQPWRPVAFFSAWMNSSIYYMY